MPKPRQIFVNLPVRELSRSIDFFRELGFRFDPRFTDARAGCMVVSDQGFVMLLQESFFRTFTAREPCNTTTHTEALIALSCESREEVDALVERAVAMGGSRAMPALDHGFMYEASFYDLDDHHWNVLWMDPARLA